MNELMGHTGQGDLRDSFIHFSSFIQELLQE